MAARIPEKLMCFNVWNAIHSAPKVVMLVADPGRTKFYRGVPGSRIVKSVVLISDEAASHSCTPIIWPKLCLFICAVMKVRYMLCMLPKKSFLGQNNECLPISCAANDTLELGKKTLPH